MSNERWIKQRLMRMELPPDGDFPIFVIQQ